MQFKVFPASLINGQKIPLIRGWQELASNDHAQIKLWQELFRERISFWGLPTGQINGIFGVDIDVKKVNGFESLKKLGFDIPNTLIQKTPSGGVHLLFKTEPGIHYPNSVNSELGVDTRGDGGWLAFYGFANNEPLAPVPPWAHNLAPQKQSTEVPKSAVKLSPEIAEGIFKTSIENIINAAPGESNNVLNIESYRVGQLVSSGSISREFAEAELFRAAQLRGKPPYESRATIRSGLDGGFKQPISSPFGAGEPRALIQIPAPPELPSRWTPTHLQRSDLLNTSKLRKPQLFTHWSTEDISITTADGGTGKTTLKLYEAVCLALGDRFLGFDCAQRGKTLYITGEDTAAKLGAMLGAILNQMGLFDGTPQNEAKVETVLNSILIKKDADLCLITKDRQSGFLSPNVDAMRKLLEAVEDFRPKMIVLDPISSFWGSEAALNDMNKAVTRFMSDLVERSHASVEMINHMGKSSSAAKDMTQFAGRGGSGLPSNSRVSRVLRSLPPEEFSEMTGSELAGDQTAMLCNVNKFSDGSPIYNQPFIILRDKYLFARITLAPQKVKELEREQDDTVKIFAFIKNERSKGKYPTSSVVIGYHMNNGQPMSESRIKRALNQLQYFGHMGETVQQIDNPNLMIKEKALIIADNEGKEI